MRKGASVEEVTEFMLGLWGNRKDRYSELRSELTEDLPKAEMSYLGG